MPLQARRFLEIASEFDLETRVANFFITHQHQSDAVKLQAEAAVLASKQVRLIAATPLPP